MLIWEQLATSRKSKATIVDLPPSKSFLLHICNQHPQNTISVIWAMQYNFIYTFNAILALTSKDTYIDTNSVKGTKCMSESNIF